MSAQDLFGEVPAGGTPSVRGRGPKGGKHYTKPKGYAGMPGTGPAGKTCADCEHCIRTTMSGGARTYPKCTLQRHRWTSGRGSDILTRSPACSRFEQDTAP